jgi:hypothetical protein
MLSAESHSVSEAATDLIKRYSTSSDNREVIAVTPYKWIASCVDSWEIARRFRGSGLVIATFKK